MKSERKEFCLLKIICLLVVTQTSGDFSLENRLEPSLNTIYN